MSEVFRADLIRYASVWEDADILCEALAPVARDGRLLSIASAGDNALALLTLDPREVVAVDLSAAQLACVELRRAAFRRLEHPVLLAFLGVTPTIRRPGVYAALRSDLPPETRAFWDARPEAIAGGVIHAGKFERYMRFFGTRLLPLIYGRETTEKLLFRRSPTQQERFYREVWDRPGWRALFLCFFSKPLLGRLGRDPALLEHVRASNIGRRFLARARRALTRIPTWSNPYLTYIITGNYSAEALPLYLRPEHHAAIRARLDRLQTRLCGIHETEGSYDGMNLSDLFEYFGPEQHRQVYAALRAQCRPGGRMVYWNLLVPRRGENVRALETRELHRRDKAFFYQALRVEEAD